MKKTKTYNLRKRYKLESHVPSLLLQPSVSLVVPYNRKPSSEPLNNIQTLIHESKLLKIPLEEIILLDKPTSDFCNSVTLWLIKKHINALNNKAHFGLRHFFELPLNRNIDYLYSKKIPPELLNKSIVIPNKKLEIISIGLFPFTGYKIIKRIYGKGFK
jgi:hypothetical protein